MSRHLTYNVFGRTMIVEPAGQGWRVYTVGTDGKRAPAEVPIPDFVTEDEVAQYLGDLFHESATEHHPSVTLIDSIW